MAARQQEGVEARLDEIARLLALNIKQNRPLAEVIKEMEAVGISRARSAELVGTSPGYVKIALQRSKQSATPKKTGRGSRAGTPVD